MLLQLSSVCDISLSLHCSRHYGDDNLFDYLLVWRGGRTKYHYGDDDLFDYLLVWRGGRTKCINSVSSFFFMC